MAGNRLDPRILGLIRSTVPAEIAQRLISVQPMSEEVGEAIAEWFKNESLKEKENGNQIVSGSD